MRIKPKIKWLVDLLMTVSLLCLMAYQVIGEEFHEWFGSAMLVLFILHNVLNAKWYLALFKGKYTAIRIIRAIVNIGVFVAMVCLGFSGIVMSRHVFAALPINGPMATARTMHLAASYWGFVLMSVHLGLHWSMVVGMVKSINKGKRNLAAGKWCARILAVIIAGYGLYSFCKADIVSYMFLKNQFVFFDFEQPAYSVFAEYAAMMGFFVLAAHYIAKAIGLVGKKNKRKDKQHEKEN